MSYSYQKEREKLFTEEGQEMFIRIRDSANKLLEQAGAFRWDKLDKGSGDSWMMMACVDRMVELGELVKWERPSWAQYEVYTSPKVHNR